MAVLLVAATALTAVVYPVLYDDVVASTWRGCLLMVARNGLLAVAAGLSFARLWRGTTENPHPSDTNGTDDPTESHTPVRNPDSARAIFPTGPRSPS